MKKTAATCDKPYNRCLSCDHRQVRCDGPRTSAMTLDRWCEFMRDMKELNGLTNAEIAEKSGVSIRRIEKIMSLSCETDIMRETARAIEDAIIGSSNQYPCHLAFEAAATPESEQKLTEATRELERALADNQDYRAALDKIHESYNAEMQLIRVDAQKKIDFLLDEVQRLRVDCEKWRYENDRKGKMIDQYISKLIMGAEK